MEQAEYLQVLEEHSFISEISEGLDTEHLLRAQRADKYLQQVNEWIANGVVLTKEDLKKLEDKELRVYGEQLEFIEEMDGILYKKYIPNIPMAKQI